VALAAACECLTDLFWPGLVRALDAHKGSYTYLIPRPLWRFTICLSSSDTWCQLITKRQGPHLRASEAPAVAD
jgi:hypothetical protein